MWDINCENIKKEKDKKIIELKKKITELKLFSKSRDNPENEIRILDCAVCRYAISVDKNFKCKGRKTIKCGTNEILLNSLHSITCENDSILVTPKGKPEVKCGKQNFEGLIEPRIDELCHTIRSIEFDVTK